MQFLLPRNGKARRPRTTNQLNNQRAARRAIATSIAFSLLLLRERCANGSAMSGRRQLQTAPTMSVHAAVRFNRLVRERWARDPAAPPHRLATNVAEAAYRGPD